MTTKMTPVALDTLSLAALLAVYNEIAKPINKFSSKAEATRRTGTALENAEKILVSAPEANKHGVLVVPVATYQASLQPAPAPVAEKPAPAVERPASVPAALAKRGPRPEHADEDRIRVLVAANPKRGKSASAARFALYRKAMTIREYLEACAALQGGRPDDYRGDLRWDTGRGFISTYQEDTQA